MKKVIQFVLILLVSLLTLNAENFVIDAYDISITVNEDSSMHVKETILADFTEASHGLYRDIQYRFSNPDGNFADPVKAEVSNITSCDLYKVEKEDGSYRIYLGDEDEYVEGEKEYVIEYDYNLGRDLYSDHDELYYNIISPAWDTMIWNISWSVTFPKAIEKNRIWVTYGEEGSTTEGNYSLSPDRKTISGKQSGLRSYGGITLLVTMDEGYWKGIKEREDNSTPYLYLSVIISLALLVITVIIWRLYGTDRPINPVATAEIPESFSPMELRYIIEDGKKEPENDLSAMVIYWADRGFIKITGIEEEKGKKRYNDYSITKLKDLPQDTSEAEKTLFSLVVTDEGTTFTGIGKDGFCDKYDKVKRKLSEEFGKGERRLKRRLSSVLEGILLVLYLITAITDGLLLSLKFPGILSILFALLLVVLFACSSVTGSKFQARKAYWKRKQKEAAVIEITAVTLLVIAACIFLIHKAYLNLPAALIAVIADSLSLAFGSFMASHVEQKTQYGHDILEKCLGVRKFIEECKEKETYSSLLPYASALGLGESWSEKYKDTVINNPIWYEGEFDDDTFFCFYLLFRHTMHHAYDTGNSDYSSSSSSGGSVGGGFSGGGGGSW